MSANFPRELLYVQKLHFFTFLLTITALSGLIGYLALGSKAGLLLILMGIILSYFLTLRQSSFLAPRLDSVARKLAQNVNKRVLDPSIAAMAATQMFYLLGETRKPEQLLKFYLDSDEPFIHTTLADLYLQQNQINKALESLEKVRQFDHPLVHWTYGRLFLRQQDWLTAMKHLDRAWNIVRTQGLPKTKTGILNRIFMTWSVKSSILHGIAECNYKMGNPGLGKKYMYKGNLYLIDPAMWKNPTLFS